jgi:hypothetical protein
MSNSSDIKAQINDIYKSDVQSIRNLAEISQKLQKGGLEIPGDLTIKGNLTANTKLIANNIQSNTLVNLKNSLETKLNALQSKLTKYENQTNSSISNLISKTKNISAVSIGGNMTTSAIRKQIIFPSQYRLDRTR